jgi:Protein of unknown function (DUF3485)
MYPIRRACLTKRMEGFYSVRAVTEKTPTWFAWVLAVSLLVFAGITYRVLASHLKLLAGTPVKLPVPLTAFPKQIGHWVGEDVPIAPNILRVAGNDAYLNRLYLNKVSNEWANVYIAYTAHPRTMLGHRPQICYVAGGWVHDGTQQATIRSVTGQEVPCLIHRFHRPVPESEETIVLNFYIVNGRLTSDERVFSGVGWRTPNIDGDPARYVVQVQISSALENSVRAAATEMVEQILDFFPDQKGQVRAAQYVRSVSSAGK